jgi:hypothetical protein
MNEFDYIKTPEDYIKYREEAYIAAASYGLLKEKSEEVIMLTDEANERLKGLEDYGLDKNLL